MELVFRQQEINRLELLFHETISQEQTAELILPDSDPELNRVVDCFGTAIISERSNTPGCTTLSGGIQAGVLYVPEGETEPKLLETYLPFSVRRDSDAVTERAKVQWNCRIKEADARMLNGRKILIRIGITCEVAVYGEKTDSLPDVEQPVKSLCLKRTTVPMVVPLDAAEKAFAINDEVNLPDSAEAIDRVLKVLYRIEQGDTKIVGNKALFKGTVHLHALYRSMEGTLCAFDGELPFSQYVELSQDFDEQEARVEFFFSGAQVEPDGQMECHRLLAALNLVAQCVVYGTREVSYVEDAYDLQQELVPQWQTLHITGRLDSQQLRDTLAGSVPVPANRVLELWAYPQDVLRQRSGDQLDLQYGLACNVMYYDEMGVLQGKTVHISQTQTIALAATAQCFPVLRMESAVTCQSGAEPQLRCRVCLQVDSFARQDLRMLCGGELKPMPPQTDHPSLILRRVQPEESLWSIAKTNRTTTERLLDANGLTEIPAEGTMLLIPM